LVAFLKGLLGIALFFGLFFGLALGGATYFGSWGLIGGGLLAVLVIGALGKSYGSSFGISIGSDE